MPKQNKTVIVTGAASGIGRAMALGLSEAGFDVVAVDRNSSALGPLPDAIKRLAADLAQPDSFDRIVSETLSAFGRIGCRNARSPKAARMDDYQEQGGTIRDSPSPSPRHVAPFPGRACRGAATPSANFPAPAAKQSSPQQPRSKPRRES